MAGQPILCDDPLKNLVPRTGADERRAALNLPGMHLVLAEHLDGKPRPNTYLRHPSLKLFIVTADDAELLLSQLHTLDQRVHQEELLGAVADEWAAAYQEHPGIYTVVLLGRTVKELSREIQQALSHLPQIFEQGGEWFTPSGSYFTANPLGRKGKLAFVYPGAFNSYPRMGQDLLFLFPHLHEDLMDITFDLGQVARRSAGSIRAAGKTDPSALEADSRAFGRSAHRHDGSRRYFVGHCLPGWCTISSKSSPIWPWVTAWAKAVCCSG